MADMKKVALEWELAGIIFIIVLGTVLHFAFEWAGEWRPIAISAAVNESVWEHLKLGFWSALFFSFIEYPFVRTRANNIFVAKAVGILVIPISIVVLFYAYTAFTEDILVADILVFVVAVVLGQMASYKILSSRQLPAGFDRCAIAVLVCLILVFVLPTFFPPHLPLFRDPISGMYGIP
jgi:hypothetical protein